MRLASIKRNNRYVGGVVVGHECILLPDRLSDLVTLLESGPEAIAEVTRWIERAEATRVSLDDAVLGSPIQRFRRDVLCCGWNYWDHFYESAGKREGQDVPKPNAPTFFTKSPATVIGPNDPIAFDERISRKWDYEAEIAIVFGKAGRSIPKDRAWEHVAGIMLANDVSQRDLQRRHGGQWLKGKSIDLTMPLGPFIVTPDEVDVPNLHFELTLNGQLMQSASVKQMAFPIEELIAELTFGMSIYPGDVLLTGTPSGIGNAREPAVFLKENDEVVVKCKELGKLSNRVVRLDLAEGTSVKLFD